MSFFIKIGVLAVLILAAAALIGMSCAGKTETTVKANTNIRR